MAGAFAAIKARECGADVLVVDKAFFGRGGAAALASGAYGAYMPGDQPEDWMKGAGDLVNQALRWKAAQLTHELLLLMDQWGVEFVKERGEFVRFKSPSEHGGNVGLVGGGPRMMTALRAEALKRGCRVRNRMMITDLLTSDGEQPTGGRVIGAVGINTRSAEIGIFRAKAVVMCAGGYNIPYPMPGEPLPSMPVDLSGDGVAAQLRAGARTGDLAIGGTKIHSYEFHTAPGLEHLTGQGVRWVNAKGEPFLERYRSAKSGINLQLRRSLPGAIARELQGGRGPVYLDATHFSPEQIRFLRLVIPIIMGNYERAGYDLSRDRVPYLVVSAATHGVNGGGAAINSKGETSIPGLFAAGSASDAASTMISQSLWGCSVFGWWAGEHAARYAREQHFSKIFSEQVRRIQKRLLSPMKRKGGTSYREVHERVKSIFIELGTILNESKLTEAIDKIQAIREGDVRDLRATDPHDLVKVLGLSNVTEVGELVLRFLKHRTESRGSVLREDFPYADNERWLVRTFARKQANGEIALWDEPIHEEEWVFRKPVREKTLHPFFRALER